MKRLTFITMVVFLLTSLVFSSTAFAKKRASVILIETLANTPMEDFLREYVAVYIYSANMRKSYKNNYYLINGNARNSKLTAKIKYAAKYHDQVDVYTLVHGYQDGLVLHDHEIFGKSDIQALKGNKLRFVFQMNCWGSYLNSSWRNAGARSVLGSTKINVLPFAYYPMFVNLFKKRHFKLWYLKRVKWWKYVWKSKNIDTSYFLFYAAWASWNFSKHFESIAKNVSGIHTDVNSYKKRSGTGWLKVTSN